MRNEKRRVNLIFGCVVGLLAATSVTSMLLERNRPPIREAAMPDLPPDVKLPENHPPIDSSARLATLEQMSRNDPQNPDPKVQIGNIYYDMGQYRKAIDYYRESLKLRPEDPSVETDMATCYHYLGDHDKALETLDRVLQYRPNFPQALFNKGVVLQAGKNDVNGAVSAWESLLRSNPDFAQRAELERKIQQLKSQR